MDLGEMFTNLPAWLLFAMVTIFSMLIVEAGAWIGDKKYQRGIRAPDAPVGTAVSAMLGLLAFMLGFTFSITADRYGERKNLVIKHANAIGTSYLRASFLPEMQKKEVRKLYREYSQLLTGMREKEIMDASLDRMEEIHLLLWAQTASLNKEEIDSEVRSLFIASVNEVIDLSAERETVGLVFRVPNALWTSLVLLTALSMFLYGYQTGINGSRRAFEMPLLPVGFALIIVLIADMDSLNKNRFQVSDQPIKNLQKMMQYDFP